MAAGKSDRKHETDGISNFLFTETRSISIRGKRRFGIYRFLPFFFLVGGVMEWVMINVRVGRETFYDVYRRKRSEREYQQKIEDGIIVLPESESK